MISEMNFDCTSIIKTILVLPVGSCTVFVEFKVYTTYGLGNVKKLFF